MIEFIGMCSSVCGLTLVIMEYEWDMSNGAYHGLGELSDTSADKDTSLAISNAINDRIYDSWTNFMRILNCFTCIISLSCLYFRRKLKTEWINKYFNEQLKRERMNTPYIEFCNLDVL